MTNFAYVFPGQGSQSVGMMGAWEGQSTIVEDIYSEASDALGYDLWRLVSEGPESRLNLTEITQPAMLCAGVASWRIVSQSQGMPEAAMMAGHSLGEYTALVCAGSLDLTSAIKLVARRGQLMQSAVAEGEGSMAAIIGLSDEEIINACEGISNGVVEAVNFNAPGQVVIAGETAALELAMERAKQLGAKRALLLPVSGPFHSSLMKTVADQLAEELEALTIEMPQVPVIHNQNASVANSADEIRELLKLQVYHPVKWVASIRCMHQRGVGQLIECGPGKVLAGLARRIEKSLQAFAVFDAASLENTQQSLREDEYSFNEIY